MGAWEHGSMGAWEHGSMGAWEHGSMGAHKPTTALLFLGSYIQTSKKAAGLNANLDFEKKFLIGIFHTNSKYKY
jgi:hypothetical protein